MERGTPCDSNSFGVFFSAGNRFDPFGVSVNHHQKVSETLHSVVCPHVSVVDGDVFEWGIWNREFAHRAFVDRFGVVAIAHVALSHIVVNHVSWMPPWNVYIFQRGLFALMRWPMSLLQE